MLSSTVLLIMATLLLLGAGFAQTTTQATKSQPTGQIVPALTQQIGPAFVMAPDEQGDYGFGAVLQTLELHRLGSSSVFPTAPIITHSGIAETATQPEPELSNAPGATPKPAGKCGPSWLGGCWDVHAPRRSNWGVVTDPYFVGPTVADALVTSLDSAVTAYGLGHSPCLERNTDLGKNPSDAKIAGVNALIFGVTTGFRFVALKAIPKDNHSRWAWIPRAFSIGTAARSAQVHISGAMSWFSSGCL